MEVGDDDLVHRLRAHVNAARRQMSVARKHPEASRGLMRAARFHVGRAATLAEEICREAPTTDKAVDAPCPTAHRPGRLVRAR